MTFKSCLKSMRLRTLPLSLSGVILGSALAASRHPIDWTAVIFLVLTTISLQVLSNLSNELGDSLHGVDNAYERQGMHYSIMDGEITVVEMKKLIALTIVLCCIFGTLMIYFSFGTLFSFLSAVFILLGAAAIWAAMHYTLGDNPYGYRGKGDVFVFVFFGLVSVCGSYFICCGQFDDFAVILPACSVGCFSIGVLNVNNIRDMRTDAANRVTVAIRLGLKRARLYQTALISLGFALMAVFSILNPCRSWLYLLTAPLFILHLTVVWKKEDRALDPMLPLLVLSTFLFSILASV